MKWKILLLFLLLVPLAYAGEGSMKLLAVTEQGDEMQGSVADLYLKIVPGSGRVFLETYPISKVDTQISTRFAKEIACSFLEKDCSKYDFFYTIRANTYIIGGPSGSSAMSALTVFVLEDKNYDESVAITGTINSGGFVGPVGGIKQKIEAAAKQNMSKVLIPTATRKVMNDTSNETFDLIDYGNELGIEVKEIADLNEVIYEFSGIKYEESTNITVDDSYKNTMKLLAETLCGKSIEMQKEIVVDNQIGLRIIDENLTRLEYANNLTEKGLKNKDKKNYYSAASFCFGANVQYGELIVEIKNDTNIDEVVKQIDAFNDEIESKKYQTITDLQAYMIVKERIEEAKDTIVEAHKKFKNNESIFQDIAYAKERLFSAKSWAKFMGSGGKEYEFSSQVLEDSCSKKIGEAEERYQYLELFLPNANRDELNKAKQSKNKGKYELCLFRASKAKAQIDSVLSIAGVREESIEEYMKTKLKSVEKNIAKNINKGIFPIVGYSYYEYSQSLLEEEDWYSASLYGEYALELSNFDMYFPEIHKRTINLNDFKLFFWGFLLGAICFGLLARKSK